MSEYRIVQMMPCPVPMKACYMDFDEEIIKQDVMFIAIIHDISDDSERKVDGCQDFVRPFVSTKEGDFIDPSWLDDFLGIEYDGVRQDFDAEIREIVKERDKRQGACRRVPVN